jgi:hypothetical protein
LKLSFNKSGENSFSAPTALLTRLKPRAKINGPLYGNYLRILVQGRERPKSAPRRARRIHGVLAPVLRQGFRPLPPGVALYARAGSSLPRQAAGDINCRALDPPRTPNCQGSRIFDAPVTAGSFLAAGAFRAAGSIQGSRLISVPGACARRHDARRCHLPGGAFRHRDYQPERIFP